VSGAASECGVLRIGAVCVFLVGCGTGGLWGAGRIDSAVRDTRGLGLLLGVTGAAALPRMSVQSGPCR